MVLLAGMVLEGTENSDEFVGTLHVQGLGFHHGVLVLGVDQELAVADRLIRAIHHYAFHADLLVGQ